MKRSVFALSLVPVGLLLAACGGSPQPEAKTPSSPSVAGGASGAAASSLKAPGEAKVGDKTTCPVSGEEFVVESSSLHVEHQGKTYYFCCPGCRKKFESNPAKFTKS